MFIFAFHRLYYFTEQSTQGPLANLLLLDVFNHSFQRLKSGPLSCQRFSWTSMIIESSVKADGAEENILCLTEVGIAKLEFKWCVQIIWF